MSRLSALFAGSIGQPYSWGPAALACGGDAAAASDATPDAAETSAIIAASVARRRDRVLGRPVIAATVGACRDVRGRCGRADDGRADQRLSVTRVLFGLPPAVKRTFAHTLLFLCAFTSLRPIAQAARVSLARRKARARSDAPPRAGRRRSASRRRRRGCARRRTSGTGRARPPRPWPAGAGPPRAARRPAAAPTPGERARRAGSDRGSPSRTSGRRGPK